MLQRQILRFFHQHLQTSKNIQGKHPMCICSITDSYTEDPIERDNEKAIHSFNKLWLLLDLLMFDPVSRMEEQVFNKTKPLKLFF